ncbi:MAG: efflux RND transporter permease subunit [Deltaproteobacteria bacterium]|nr:efflux RND transporter permease subunit [Deltaproteobacteria bacterium]
MSRQDRMAGTIAWMAKNSVSANLLMAAIVIGGLAMAFFQLRQEVFPQVEPDYINITVPYPGASPEEVEQGILLVLEESVRSLDGIKQVDSTGSEGAGSVSLELEIDADKNKVLADVKNAVDRIVTFPQEAERPIVMAPRYRSQAISVVIYGDQEEKVLREIAEQARDEMLDRSDISYVAFSGARPLEISIEVPRDKLRSLGLTLPQIASKIRRTALEIPAGGIKTRGGEVLLRTAERRDLGEEFRDIPILTTRDGTPVRLDAIAEIKDGFAETDVSALYEGKRAVTLDVYSVGNESPTEVAAATKEYVELLRNNLPPGVFVSTWGDMAELYSQRLDLLLRNAQIGLVLVLIILGLFLEPRLAFWVTAGIPISFMGAFLVLPSLDISLNMVSLFAFIVTLGMVVDDAIVVGENIFRLRRQGVPPLDAAIRGAREVAMPVAFSVITTIAAFAPLLFIPGTRGKFMYVIPAVVILVLAVSLIESFFILPAHLGHLGKPRLFAFVIKHQQKVSRAVERFIDRFYAPVLRAALRQRWITLALCIAIFIGTVGLVSGGIVKFTFWPEEESDWIVVEAKLPFGAPVQETEKVMQRLVDAAHETMKENGGKEISRGMFSVLGAARRETGGHMTFVVANLVPTEQRPVSSSEFASKWRKKVGRIPGLESLSFDSSTGRSSAPIDIELSHRNVKVLETAAADLAKQLASYTGLKNIDDGVELGKDQIDFKLSHDGLSAGLTSTELAAQVRGAYYGIEALRQQRGRNEIRVMVRLPRKERETLASVENLIIRTPAGGEMPLRQAAKVKHGRAYTTIRRTDGRRTIRVKAYVEEDQANTQEVLDSVFAKDLPHLRDRYDGISFGSAGRQKSNDEFFDFLKFAYILALVGIYILIAIPLRSYTQPLFVVMIAIPFGIVGAILGHLVMGYDLSLISMLGMIALSGVVVNDSLVLVDAANRFKIKGMDRFEAGEAAGKRRFRAVILTSLTTFGGLTPMILETSVQARMLIPMAISLGFGVLFSTMITLFLVPSLFVMIEKPRDWLREYKAANLDRGSPEKKVSAGETA